MEDSQRANKSRNQERKKRTKEGAGGIRQEI
jgi:hypothetical protein